MLAAESTARYWTDPDPVGRYVHYGMRKHFSRHNNNNNNTPAWVIKREEWNNVISDDQHQNQPSQLPIHCKITRGGCVVCSSLCLHYRSLPTWQLWPIREQFRIKDIAPAPDTSYQWEKFPLTLLSQWVKCGWILAHFSMSLTNSDQLKKSKTSKKLKKKIKINFKAKGKKHSILHLARTKEVDKKWTIRYGPFSLHTTSLPLLLGCI